MLKSVREFFQRTLAPAADGTASAHTIELATAALLVEVVRSDAGISEAERAAVLSSVRAHFTLSAEEAETLLRLAEEEVRQANDLFQFTSLINRHYDVHQKARIVEQLWRAALADEHISAHEHHLLRRIADLLHVPHGDIIAARRRAQGAAD